MSGAVTEAISILSAAMWPESPHFVKKPEFSQEVVSRRPNCFLKDTDIAYVLPSDTKGRISVSLKSMKAKGRASCVKCCRRQLSGFLWPVSGALAAFAE